MKCDYLGANRRFDKRDNPYVDMSNSAIWMGGLGEVVCFYVHVAITKSDYSRGVSGVTKWFLYKESSY